MAKLEQILKAAKAVEETAAEVSAASKEAKAMNPRPPKDAPPLERAPAKSKKELEEIAQRVAPQITGEFVKGKTSANILGMSKKRFEREKELEHDIRQTETPSELKMFDYPSAKGSVQVGVFGDPTISGKAIHGVAGKELPRKSEQFGGPHYNLYHPEDAWASEWGAAAGLQNLAYDASHQYGGAPVVGMYTKMGPAAYGHAQHLNDAIMMNIVNELPNMSKKQIDAFNTLVRNNPKAKDFAGIEHPEISLAQMAENSEMRKQFYNLAIQPTLTERLNMPNGLDVVHAALDPDLRYLETGITGHSVVELDPTIRSLKPAAHPTYDTRIPRKAGTDVMQTEVPIPYELQYPDQLLSISKNPRQAPQPFGTLMMSGARQIIDPQHIDEIGLYRDFIKKYTGKAKGGAVDLEEEYRKADIMEKRPQEGGVRMLDYPNPYGLRAFETSEGYGGEMMPKTSGWAGEIPSLAKEGQVLTEVSLGGEKGEPFYPMIFEGITPEQIEIVRDYEAGLREDDDPAVMAVKQLAKNKALTRMHMHKSPFKDVKMADGGVAKTLAAPIEGYAKSAEFLKELSHKAYDAVKEDVKKANIRMPTDVLTGIGADILGIPGMVADLTIPTLNEEEAPNFKAFATPEYLKEKALKSGVMQQDYPAITTAVEFFPGTTLKAVKSIPAAGKALVKEAGRRIEEGKVPGLINPKQNIIPEVGGNFGVDFSRPSEEVINSHKKDFMPGDQWHSWIQSNAPRSVKKELETSGTMDMLKNTKDKLTKQDVINHLRENEPRLRSKTYAPYGDHPYEVVGSNETGWDVVDTSMGDKPISSHESQDAAYEAMHEAVNVTHPISKYKQYTLPGGEEYREIVIQDKPKIWSKDKNFESTHYPEATNPIAHLRVNHRDDAEGKPTLFIEEIQSDWGQKGKKEGFGKKMLPTDMSAEDLLNTYRDNLSYSQKSWLNSFIGQWEAVDAYNNVPDQAAKLDRLTDQYQNWVKHQSFGVHHGPYVEDTKDWTALAIKQAIKEAIDNGKTQVAWTNGTQQAERYDLSKHLSSVSLRPSEYSKDKVHLMAIDHSGNPVIEKTVKEDDLDEYIGKDLANKLINTPPGGDSNIRRLEGLDIKVGGEGMKGYYDNIVPQVANDVIKQLGGKNKVKPIKIILNDLGNDYGSSEQLGFEITPEMIKHIQTKGIPKHKSGGSVTKRDLEQEFKLNNIIEIPRRKHG